MEKRDVKDIVARGRKPGRSVLDAMDQHNMRMGRVLGAALLVADVAAVASGAVSVSLLSVAGLVLHAAACAFMVVCARTYLAAEGPMHHLARRAVGVYLVAAAVGLLALSASYRLEGVFDVTFALLLASTVMTLMVRPVSAVAYCVAVSAAEGSILVAIDGPTKAVALWLAVLCLVAVGIALGRFVLVATYQRELDHLSAELAHPRAGHAAAAGLVVADAPAATDAPAPSVSAEQSDTAPELEVDPHLGPGQTSFDFVEQDTSVDEAPLGEPYVDEPDVEDVPAEQPASLKD